MAQVDNAGMQVSARLLPTLMPSPQPATDAEGQAGNIAPGDSHSWIGLDGSPMPVDQEAVPVAYPIRCSVRDRRSYSSLKERSRVNGWFGGFWRVPGVLIWPPCFPAADRFVANGPGRSRTGLSGLARKFVGGGDHAAKAWSWVVSWASMRCSRSLRSVRVKFQLNGLAIAL
jgi:hypothetical protein